MRILRLALISFIILFLLLTFISLFFPSHVRISKAINISNNLPAVKTQIANIQNWKNWYPGADSMKLFYENGVCKGVVADSSRKLVLIIKEATDSSVKAAFLGGDRKHTEIGWNFMSAAGADSLTVQWYMDFHLHWYPWEKFSSLMYEKVYGYQMERGLSRLKSVIEK